MPTRPTVPKSDPETARLFETLLPHDPRIVVRPMFGHRAAFVNGNMFAGTFGADVFVRLDEHSRSELLAISGSNQGRHICTIHDRAYDGETLVPAALDGLVAFLTQSAFNAHSSARTTSRHASLHGHRFVGRFAIRRVVSNQVRAVLKNKTHMIHAHQGVPEALVLGKRIGEHFERSFSVDAVRKFKPAAEVYRLVATELQVAPPQLRLVAAHAWDVLGAMRAGCAAAFAN